MTLLCDPVLEAAEPLADRVALVTGSTSGIGLGIAAGLAEAGAAVVLNGFGKSADIAAAMDILTAKHGVASDHVDADLASAEEATRMVEEVLRRHGRIDILVNNAGIQHVAPAETFPPAKWDAILAINLSAAFHAARTALPAMRANGFGRIINIASAHALVGSPFKSGYVAAKHGVVGLTKVLALETAEEPITVNAVCPGYVLTPLVEQQIEAQARAHGIAREAVIRDVLLKAQPNKRFATVEEIGALVAFLCSESARSITGAAIPVDGGWTAQ
jgi:3-hydroxybutyrate dehydrogenase